MAITRKSNKVRTAGLAIIWPSGLDLMFDVSSETRRRWERAGLLPKRDVFLGGQPIGWRPETLAAAMSGNVAQMRGLGQRNWRHQVDSENCTTRVKGPPLRQIERQLKAHQFFRTHCSMQFVERDVDGERLVRFEEKHTASYRPPGKVRGDWWWMPVPRGRWKAVRA
jgi:hypothetical protein